MVVSFKVLAFHDKVYIRIGLPERVQGLDVTEVQSDMFYGLLCTVLSIIILISFL